MILGGAPKRRGSSRHLRVVLVALLAFCACAFFVMHYGVAQSTHHGPGHHTGSKKKHAFAEQDADALQAELSAARAELEDAQQSLHDQKKLTRKLSKAAKKREEDDARREAERQRFVITVCVFTYNRLTGLKRLMASLQGARYLNHRVDLTVFKDKLKENAESDGTEDYLRALSWPHGNLRIHMREHNAGLKNSILEAWYPTNDEDSYAAFFEDDIEASPLWYVWAHNAITAYGGKERSPRNLGISLYRPIHDELTGGKMTFDTSGDPYVLQQPCSWGAVYFPGPWRKFRDWYDEEGHVKDPIAKGRGLPRISSNTWSAKSSWKKYLIKYMWEHGLFMVYPNTPKKTVLATNHLMKGEHPTPSRKLFELPLLSAATYDESMQDGTDLLRAPPLASLKAYDTAIRPVSSYEKMPQIDGEY
eukprot:Rhum_TRINITY_DN14668_c41_g1::Rhum_TRINITY_DN14668_c41_g1_i1::g.109491::m.109491